MAKKADAWKEYKEAAMLDMFLESLPKVAAEVAAPLSQAKKITMVSDGSGEKLDILILKTFTNSNQMNFR